jgi:hypothetical protein
MDGNTRRLTGLFEMAQSDETKRSNNIGYQTNCNDFLQSVASTHVGGRVVGREKENKGKNKKTAASKHHRRSCCARYRCNDLVGLRFSNACMHDHAQHHQHGSMRPMELDGVVPPLPKNRAHWSEAEWEQERAKNREWDRQRHAKMTEAEREQERAS